MRAAGRLEEVEALTLDAPDDVGADEEEVDDNNEADESMNSNSLSINSASIIVILIGLLLSLLLLYWGFKFQKRLAQKPTLIFLAEKYLY